MFLFFLVEDDGLISMTDIENWLSTCGLATYILESVFHYMFPISHVSVTYFFFISL